jgi:Icc-related predicted phosphoesterase
MSIVRIAVIGDPHFASRPNGNKHSKLLIPSDRVNQPIEMWDKLVQLVKDEGLKADLLLTPGDITTFSDIDALKYGWSRLQELGSQLSAQALIASTGNHDVRSRLNKRAPKNLEQIENRGAGLVEQLKLLSPTYPVHDYIKVDQDGIQHQIDYFGSTLTSYEGERARVLVFNTCNKHTDDPLEYERGAFEDSTAKYLDRYLKSCPKKRNKVNIFLCHHRPTSQSDDGKNYDFIHNGDRMLTKLQNHGPWLLIHGHKHVGNISYAAGSSTHRAVIFSAASLGAKTESLDSSDIVNNEIYFLDVDLDVQTDELRGKITVFRWSEADLCWFEFVDERVGLSSSVGFGCQNVKALSDSIAKKLTGELSGKWDSVRSSFYELNYLMPSDHRKLLEMLENSHEIKVIVDARTGRHEVWTRIGVTNV